MDTPAYVVNVDGAVCRDDEYLLIERGAGVDHASGELGLPGGRMEDPPADEDAIEATVRRELREEVGLEVTAVEYVSANTFEDDHDTPCLNVVTYCEASGEAHARATDEVAAIHWLSADEIADREDVPPYTERDVRMAERVRTGTAPGE
jgi:8-oxo-dGTP diphosphatase